MGCQNASGISIAALLVLLSVFSMCMGKVQAVKYGDEHFNDVSNGTFVGFGDGFINFVKMPEAKLIRTIYQDINGNSLLGPSGNGIQWADAVYAECKTNSTSDTTESIKSYVFVNQRDQWFPDDIPQTDELFTNEPYSYVSVIDMDLMEVVANIKVGARPIHIYSVPLLNEIWTHPDGSAEFDVIHCDDISKPSVENIKANVAKPGHGKLLTHPALGSTAYATHTGEPFIFELNLQSKELITSHSIEEAELCSGLHAIDYSPINDHLYAECTGGGGVIEYDARSDRLVHQWLGEGGSLYESPDGGFIVSSNKVGKLFHVWQPNRNAEKSTKPFKDVLVPNPGSPKFIPTDKVEDATGYTFQDYLVFTPLANNPSRNFIECKYDADGIHLAIENGVVLTPNCGSCNPEPLYDGKLSGFAWFDLLSLIDVEEATFPYDPFFISAGGVIPSAPYPYSPECGYGRTYRKASKGGKFIATGADLDANPVMELQRPAMMIIDTETKSLYATIHTTSKPATIVFVPDVKGLLPPNVGGNGTNDE